MTKLLLVVIGTRPEAIKLSPLVKALRARPDDFEVIVCAAWQHVEMLSQAFHWFELEPDENIPITTKDRSLTNVAAAVLSGVDKIIRRYKPKTVIVQGDTATAVAAANAGFYARTPVAHVEAGLRSGDRDAPWPEEINRILISRLASIHFAPTKKNADILRAENVAGTIHIVGNTVLDALILMQTRLQENDKIRHAALTAISEAGYKITDERPFILVTGHRRESFDGGLANICRALAEIARNCPDVDILYAVHLNPQVQEIVYKMLADVDNIYLLPPFDYAAFVLLMSRCCLILTDSGGIQEEAPTLDKPVLVLRNVTERPEVIDCGAAQLVGTDSDRIVAATMEILDNDALYQSMAAAKNPYGDGHASRYIADILAGL